MFHGNSVNNTISDSVFKNITLKNSTPVISDSKYSSLKITNTEFNNLK